MNVTRLSHVADEKNVFERNSPIDQVFVMKTGIAGLKAKIQFPFEKLEQTAEVYVA
jgi:hypothetical protein